MTPPLREETICQDLSRREFLRRTSLVSLGVAAPAGSLALAGSVPPAAVGLPSAPGTAAAADLPSGGKPIKLFCCDLNWVRLD